MMKPGGGSKRLKPGRFNVVKRIKSRRKSSASVNEAEELVLKNVELDSPSSAITLDVLGRESISTLDTERDEDYYENSVADQQEEQEDVAAAPGAPLEVTERTVSIQTWCKFLVLHSLRLFISFLTVCVIHTY